MTKIVAVTRRAKVQQSAARVCESVLVADDPGEALDITKTAAPDLLVFDDSFGMDRIGLAVDTLKKHSIKVPVAVAGQGGKDREACIAAGAAYIGDEEGWTRLEKILSKAEKTAGADAPVGIDSNRMFVNSDAEAVALVGQSKALVSAFETITLVAKSQCNPVLIVGETGTGKELAARAVHNLRHQDGPFVAVNCAALTATLLESELFGHVKGAFTGAERDKTGLLEQAGSGTIFLDEISEMPMDLQAKLLRVLQERTFRKVGDVADLQCEATIIASSNRDLHAESRAGRFRSDLYYRLNVCPITMPSLAQRREDVELLAEYFVRTSTICPNKSRKIKCLTKLAVERLRKHSWPGNVRELQNIIERAILHETTDKIGLNTIEAHLTHFEDESGASVMKDFSLAKAERELIGRALRETEGKKSRAAALLGISRATLYDKLKLYKIAYGSNGQASKTASGAGSSSRQLVGV